MRYITPRKAAQGLGSARSGTHHHWQMTVSSYALIILTPLFLIAVGAGIGLPREELMAHFGRPFPGVITALFIIVGMVHFIKGTRIMLDDYLYGNVNKLAIVALEHLRVGRHRRRRLRAGEDGLHHPRDLRTTWLPTKRIRMITMSSWWAPAARAFAPRSAWPNRACARPA